MSEVIKSTIRQVRRIHREMKDTFIRSGIQEPQYDAILKNITHKAEDQLIELLNYLKECKSGPYKEIKKIWSELPSEIWERYESHLGLYNTLPEQKILAERQKALRSYWNKRPRNGKSDKDTNVPENMCIRSEKAGTNEDNS